MTQLRTHIYNLLTVQDIQDVAPGGVTPRGGFEDTPQQRPFIIYVFSVQSVEPRWDGPRRLTLRVYVHDDVGDYLRIEDTHDLIEEVLTSAPSATDGSGFMQCIFLERSEDFEDDVLNTFYKFARYQVVSSK